MEMRFVQKSDAPRLLVIYAPYVIDSSVSFELELPSVTEFENRIGEYSAQFPWLVMEEEGVIIGYAYASTHRARRAYQWSVECSVYIDPEHHGRKIGRTLYEELFRVLKLQGVMTVLAGITQPNEASVKFHEALGFEFLGFYRDIGFKLGKWLDTGWWQLHLYPAGRKPVPPPMPLRPYR